MSDTLATTARLSKPPSRATEGEFSSRVVAAEDSFRLRVSSGMTYLAMSEVAYSWSRKWTYRMIMISLIANVRIRHFRDYEIAVTLGGLGIELRLQLQCEVDAIYAISLHL